ncbi:MAG: hypothetical protein ACTSR3_00515, partial [Candidatus Helarchaeota archaeon]
VTHPIIDINGNINLKIFNEWKSEYHLYQIVNTLKAMFWKDTPTKLYEAKIKKVKYPSNIKKPYKKSKSKSKQDNKDLQISKQDMDKKIQVQFSLENFSPTLKDKILDLQSEKISVINLVEILDRNFQNGEISSEIYSKLYKKYYDILVSINVELTKINQNH